MTSGYNWKEYLTAMFGLKDTLAEGGNDPAHAPTPGAYRNAARSASSFDWGIRVENPWLARALGADKAWFSLGRGTKSVNWPIGVFVKNPPKYFLKDLEHDASNLLRGQYGFGWNYTSRYSVPSVLNPNDHVGILAAWSRTRLGLEYLDTSNPGDQGHRTFTHSIYLSGFYYHGDPLGNAEAGEARVTTARFEADVSRDLTLVSWLHWGIRPFRDTLELWQADHPGAQPGGDRLFGLQQTLRCKLTRGLTLDLGAAWERHGAAGYEAGHTANGFRYFTDLAYRWPRAGRD